MITVHSIVTSNVQCGGKFMGGKLILLQLYCTLPFFRYKYVLTKYYSGDQIKKNKMGGACSMHGEEARCIQGFGGEHKGRHGHGSD
jgi:hypothetical protein